MNSNVTAAEKLSKSFEEGYSEEIRGLAALQVIGMALLAAHGIADERLSLSFRGFVHGWLKERGVDEEEFQRAVKALEELLDYTDLPSILRH